LKIKKKQTKGVSMDYQNTHWNRLFYIKSDVDFDVNKIIKILNDIDEVLSIRNPNSRVSTYGNKMNILTHPIVSDIKSKLKPKFKSLYADFIRFNKPLDFSGLLHGYAVDKIIDYLKSLDSQSYLIRFSNLTVGHNIKAKLIVNNTKLRIVTSGDFKVAICSNLTSTGIKVSSVWDAQKCVTLYTRKDSYSMTQLDMLATLTMQNCNDYYQYLVEHGVHLIQDVDGKVQIDGYETFVSSYDFDALNKWATSDVVKNIELFYLPIKNEEYKKYKNSRSESDLKNFIKSVTDSINICHSLTYCKNCKLNQVMFELGYAIRQNKLIVEYSYDDFTIMDNFELIDYSEKSIVIDASKPINFLEIGYNFSSDFMNNNIHLINGTDQIFKHLIENVDGRPLTEEYSLVPDVDPNVLEIDMTDRIVLVLG
jgi:hypothetical protein